LSTSGKYRYVTKKRGPQRQGTFIREPPGPSPTPYFKERRPTPTPQYYSLEPQSSPSPSPRPAIYTNSKPYSGGSQNQSPDQLYYSTPTTATTPDYNSPTAVRDR
jgi:hypothetical protein